MICGPPAGGSPRELMGNFHDVLAEFKEQIRLEVAHVLFIDVVGYSKLSINEQRAVVDELTTIVRGSDQYQKAEAAGRFVKIPTGDGMALVFYTSQEAPAQCAIEISGALRAHPRLQVRMGVHSGPVSGVIDVNGHANLAGAGLNMAQRVMNCGDAGHILVSKHVAEDLDEYEHWRPLLHDLGECEVKHGGRVSIENLYGDEVGNPQLPKKFQALKKHSARLRWAVMTAALLALSTIVAGIVTFSRNRVGSTLAAPEKSIAVLPFENRSSDPDNAYFAAGIADEILTRLSKIADLKVISRNSTQRYRSKPTNLSEVGKQLGVANILEGSVQKIGDSVRVNVQLIKAADDSHLWADTYDRKLTDVFGVESEVAKGIAESSQAKLTGREEHALAVRPTNNPEAYDAYLRGLAFEGRSSYYYQNDPLEKAISFYERAAKLDPNFALAWARLCRADARLFSTVDTTATRREAAKQALDRAQKLQPDSAETLLALASYQSLVLRDHRLAKIAFQRVNKILPNSSDALSALARIAQNEGHWDESVGYWEQALVLDPRNTRLLGRAAGTYMYLRQFAAALKLDDRLLDILPNDPEVMAEKANIYQAEGNLEEAAKFLPDVNAQTPSPMVFGTKITQLVFERSFGEAVRLLQARLAQFHFSSELDKGVTQFGLAFIQRFAGDSAGAKVTAEQARNTLEPLSKAQPDNPVYAVALSYAYACLGNKDAALKEAGRAVALVPSAKDALYGPSYEENLALVELILGENSRAIPTLARLLQIPYHDMNYATPITPAHLRVDPMFDPLRNDPRFQKLAESTAPKE
jgi:TolB-like protein/class 3 adenylate cyclase/cytochrome c-type biogenesis protein CcmH/NrfG